MPKISTGAEVLNLRSRVFTGYDANGNMTTDGLNALNLRYNYLNLLGKVESSADSSPLASYKWLADGTKAGATTADGTFGLEYIGSLIYRRNANNELELESTAFGGGRITVSDTGNGLSYTPNYFIADHLSSTRVVVKPTIDGIEVVERNNFLPFGKKWEQSGSVITDNRFRYSGKEEQHLFSLPYNDHGMRMYDPRTGRWVVLDPLAERSLNISPFCYTYNRPIMFVDPDGRRGVFFALAEGRIQMPFKRGMGAGVGISIGLGVMVDFDSGKMAVFNSINAGGGTGGFFGTGLALGWYPTAEIDDLAGFGYNLGFSGSRDNVNFGAELNFTTDYSSEGLKEFYENMRMGGNYTPGKLSVGRGGAAYLELGYILLRDVVDFNDASVSDITDVLKKHGIVQNSQEALNFMITYHSLWHDKKNIPAKNKTKRRNYVEIGIGDDDEEENPMFEEWLLWKEASLRRMREEQNANN